MNDSKNEFIEEYLNSLVGLQFDEQMFYVETSDFEDSELKNRILNFLRGTKVGKWTNDIIKEDRNIKNIPQINVQVLVDLIGNPNRFTDDVDRLLTNVYCCKDASLNGKELIAYPVCGVCVNSKNEIDLICGNNNQLNNAYHIGVELNKIIESNPASMFYKFVSGNNVCRYYHSDEKHALYLFTKSANDSIQC